MTIESNGSTSYPGHMNRKTALQMDEPKLCKEYLQENVGEVRFVCKANYEACMKCNGVPKAAKSLISTFGRIIFVFQITG